MRVRDREGLPEMIHSSQDPTSIASAAWFAAEQSGWIDRVHTQHTPRGDDSCAGCGSYRLVPWPCVLIHIARHAATIQAAHNRRPHPDSPAGGRCPTDPATTPDAPAGGRCPTDRITTHSPARGRCPTDPATSPHSPAGGRCPTDPATSRPSPSMDVGPAPSGTSGVA